MKTRQLINTTFSCMIVALCLMSPSQASARIRIPKVKVRVPKVKVTPRLKPTRIERPIRNYDWNKIAGIGAASSIKYRQQQEERNKKRRQSLRNIHRTKLITERPMTRKPLLHARDLKAPKIKDKYVRAKVEVNPGYDD